MTTTTRDVDAALVVVVEAACTAPLQDWQELSCLVRAFVRQRVTAAAARCDAATHSNNSDNSNSRHDEQAVLRPGERLSLDGAAAPLARGVRSLRVCDLCTTTHAPRTHASMHVVPVMYALYGVDAPDRCNESNTHYNNRRSSSDKHHHHHHRHDSNDDDGDDASSACTLLPLPHVTLDGLWESLHYGEGVATSSAQLKRELLDYVVAALLFARAGVDAHCVTWNRLLLLHGPPGSGKTSLARALAHKLAVRLAGTSAMTTTATASNTTNNTTTTTTCFAHATLVEVHAHALLSRWFGESGKRVLRVFAHIARLAGDTTRLVCVLLDEVETVAAARYDDKDDDDDDVGNNNDSGGGRRCRRGSAAEPSDAMRVVTALLTQLDALQQLRNVVVVATSNVPGALDAAFADRADKRVYMGSPGVEARRRILCSAAAELWSRGLLTRPALAHKDDDNDNDATSSNDNNDDDDDVTLAALARTCAGLSGRCLRRLPFLAYSAALGERASLSLLTTTATSNTTAATPTCVHGTRAVGCVAMHAWLAALEQCIAHELRQLRHASTTHAAG